MSKNTLAPVFLANGVARNPLGSKNDDPYMEVVHAVLDLVCCIRSETPNRELGHADRFIGVGEWGLAVDAVEAALKEDFPIQSPWIAAAFERVDLLVPKNEEGNRN